jgi:hypothetical protein
MMVESLIGRHGSSRKRTTIQEHNDAGVEMMIDPEALACECVEALAKQPENPFIEIAYRLPSKGWPRRMSDGYWGAYRYSAAPVLVRLWALSLITIWAPDWIYAEIKIVGGMTLMLEAKGAKRLRLAMKAFNLRSKTSPVTLP